MFARITTVAFEGIEARAVDVQIQIGPGVPAFTIVGLPDKAVAESRERVRGALNAIGLGLPPKRITVNLAPADLPKEREPLRPAHRAWADGRGRRGRARRNRKLLRIRRACA
jgi:Subunit ChlI of Mg-chelatase